MISNDLYGKIIEALTELRTDRDGSVLLYTVMITIKEVLESE